MPVTLRETPRPGIFRGFVPLVAVTTNRPRLASCARNTGTKSLPAMPMNPVLYDRNLCSGGRGRPNHPHAGLAEPEMTMP
jgi:hypothetical protein